MHELRLRRIFERQSAGTRKRGHHGTPLYSRIRSPDRPIARWRESVNHRFLPVKEVRSDHRLSNGGEADRLTALRNPSESYRDVILRLVEAG